MDKLVKYWCSLSLISLATCILVLYVSPMLKSVTPRAYQSLVGVLVLIVYLILMWGIAILAVRKYPKGDD